MSTRKFPPDVLVLDTDSVLHARLVRGKKDPRVVNAKSYRLAANTFASAVVTPELVNEQALADVLRRVKQESGKWERASLLLPDSWFRINLLELPSLPDRPAEAMDVVRWSLKRTLPIAPEELRVAYEVIARTATHVRVLVVSALDKTLGAIERVCAAAGIEVILIEPIGLNIWNAVTERETPSQSDRVFFYVRERDFTTAVFRGPQPLFIRSRNLSPERSLTQEIRLSASYLRDALQTEGYDSLYVAGNRVDDEVRSELATTFNAPVRAVALRDFVEDVPVGIVGLDAELTACTGVFTG